MKEHLGLGDGTTLCGRPAGVPLQALPAYLERALDKNLCLTCLKIDGQKSMRELVLL